MNNSSDGIATPGEESAKFIRRLCTILLSIAGLMTICGHAATSIRIFQALVHIYRLPTRRFYTIIHWPEALHLPHYKVIRDITTILIVSLVMGAFTFNKYRVVFEKVKLMVPDWNGAVGNGHVPIPATDTDNENQILGILGAAVIGGLVGGPIGAVIAGLAASAAPPSPAREREGAITVNRNIKTTPKERELMSDIARNKVGIIIANRMATVFIVGISMMILDRVAPAVLPYLDRLDEYVLRLIKGLTALQLP